MHKPFLGLLKICSWKFKFVWVGNSSSPIILKLMISLSFIRTGFNYFCKFYMKGTCRYGISRKGCPNQTPSCLVIGTTVCLSFLWSLVELLMLSCTDWTHIFRMYLTSLSSLAIQHTDLLTVIVSSHRQLTKPGMDQKTLLCQCSNSLWGWTNLVRPSHLA